MVISVLKIIKQLTTKKTEEFYKFTAHWKAQTMQSTAIKMNCYKLS